MDPAEDAPSRPDAVLVVSVWFEPAHRDGFRARLRSLDPDGRTVVLGAATSRAKVTDLVGQWLASLDTR